MDDGELRWRVDRHAGGTVVAPAGRIDESTAGEFGERLIDEVAAAGGDGHSRLAVDLQEVAYMSSRGLRALTLAQRRAKDQDVEVVLASPSAVMREILAISRYDLVFKVFDRAEDALAE